MIYDRELDNLGRLFDIAPVPSRAEAVLAVWESARALWPTHSIDGRLEVIHDLEIVPPVLFEQIRYGDEWVIEGEGVIVERLAVR